MKQKITIKDVAKRAGVSISTVSRVINHLDRVDAATKQRVLQAVEELRYTPNNIAASLVTKKTRMIAVIVPEIINSFYIELVQGVEQYAKEMGYLTMIFSLDNDPAQERAMCAGPLPNLVDGLVVLPVSRDLSIYSAFPCPMVLLDRSFSGSHIACVTVDNFGGCRQLTEYIIQRGHRRIGLINGSRAFDDGVERQNGYLQALRDHRIPIDTSLLYQGEWYQSTGREGIRRLRIHPHPPTAVVCANNLICEGAVRELWETGVSMGEEFSIAGFDDFPLASLVTPGITVIDRPTVQQGREGAALLFAKIRGEPVPENRRTLPVRLVERGSVKDLSHTKNTKP